MAQIAGDLIRICPLCGKHNPPDETFCACGTLLADVDFTHPGVEPPAFEVEPSAVQESVICPYPDCAQPNPPGARLCVYCNRAIEQEQGDEKQYFLPPSLRAQFRLLEIMPATGGQADLALVETKQHGKCVLKLYRKGIRPDWSVIERLPASNCLVRFLDHGAAGDAAYEVMEYCAEGNLRRLLDGGIPDNETLRRFIEQMSAALTALHRQQILHRDLKPENILLRASSPLEIALTDFGASTLKMATQHFTDGARTVSYAAPEVLSGVIDEKSDWWSLGMILLEAVTGRHPYAGLSEQVVLQQLATQSVDVKDVFDDGLRMLCRGLLLRNPKKRWGAEEVARWLAGDEKLLMPEDGSQGTAVRPYQLKRSRCATRIDLALALVRYWEEGKKDLMRGAVMNWVEHDLRDFDLARDIHDIMIRRDIGDDARLLRVIVSALPGIPPFWKGRVITRETLVRSALTGRNEHVAQDVGDDREALDWLLSIYNEGVLDVLGECGNAAMAGISGELVQGVEFYRSLWERAKNLEEEWRRQPRVRICEAVDIDYLMYLAPIRMNVPPLNLILPDLVLALYDEEFPADARRTVMNACASIDDNCGWYTRLVEETPDKGRLFWTVLQRLLPFALEDAQKEQSYRQQAVQNSDKDVAEVISTIGQTCKRLLRLDGIEDMDGPEIEALRRVVSGWMELDSWVKGLDHHNATLHNLTGKIDAVTACAADMQYFLDRHQSLSEVNNIWLKPSRLILAAAIIIAVSVFSGAVASSLALLAGFGVYWRLRLARVSRVEGLRRVRRLIESARLFESFLKQG